MSLSESQLRDEEPRENETKDNEIQGQKFSSTTMSMVVWYSPLLRDHPVFQLLRRSGYFQF
jgi:hypothetical protein